MLDGSGRSLIGPLGGHCQGFGEDLRRLGYSPWGEKRQVQLLVSLSRWLEAECLGLAAVASPGVESFFVARRAAGYANLRTVRSLAPLLDYLRRIGVLEEAARPDPVGPNEVLLDRFRRYLMIERGLVEGTAHFYIHIAGLLVAEHDGIDGATFVDLKAAEVARFATEVCGGRGLSSARQAISALRSFLRFFASRGSHHGRARRRCVVGGRIEFVASASGQPGSGRPAGGQLRAAQRHWSPGLRHLDAFGPSRSARRGGHRVGA